jgi:signal transduction histidine kinase
MSTYKEIIRRLSVIHTILHHPLDTEAVQSELRQFVSKDLHGNIAPGLLVIRMYAHELRKKAAVEDWGRADELMRLADELFRSTRELIWALEPKDDNLESTIEYMIDCFHSRVDSVAATGRVRRTELPPDVRLSIATMRCVLSCAREATDFLLQNAATELEMSVGFERDALRVKLRSNNGEAGNAQELVSRTLTGLERRLLPYGGSCGIFSAAQATTVWFRVPCVTNSSGNSGQGDLLLRFGI